MPLIDCQKYSLKYRLEAHFKEISQSVCQNAQEEAKPKFYAKGKCWFWGNADPRQPTAFQLSRRHRHSKCFGGSAAEHNIYFTQWMWTNNRLNRSFHCFGFLYANLIVFLVKTVDSLQRRKALLPLHSIHRYFVVLLFLRWHTKPQLLCLSTHCLQLRRIKLLLYLQLTLPYYEDIFVGY